MAHTHPEPHEHEAPLVTGGHVHAEPEPHTHVEPPQVAPHSHVEPHAHSEMTPVTRAPGGYAYWEQRNIMMAAIALVVVVAILFLIFSAPR